MEPLPDIVCRFCFETDPFVPRISVFSPFIGEQKLIDIVRICFGVNIKEDAFCTNICEQCLVKVDMMWQFYTTVIANDKALNCIYSSVQCSDTLQQDTWQLMNTDPVKPTQRKRGRPLKAKAPVEMEHASSDHEEHSFSEAIDNEDGSLPEHPFFVNYSMCAYNCHLCPKVLQSPKLLDLHLLREHALKSEKVLCECCAKFYKPRVFYEHFRMHKDKKLVCSVCGQTYSNRPNLNRHMLLHQKKGQFACKQCDASYNQSSSLKQHVDKVHLGIVPPFKSKTALSAPKYSKAARSMSCPVCEESFYMQGKLITHLEENHPEYELKLTKCDQCPERFIRKASYFNHRLYRHSKKDYPCADCGEVLFSALHLYDHRKRHHRAAPRIDTGDIKCEDELLLE